MMQHPGSTPSEAIQSYHHRIKIHIHIWSLAVLFPFVIIQMIDGKYLLVLFMLLTCGYLGYTIQQQVVHHKSCLGDIGYPITAYATITLAVVSLGETSLFWAFPAIIATFFLLPPGRALAISTLFVCILTLVSYAMFSWQLLARMVASLMLSLAFAYVIAWLVGKQSHNLVRFATTDPLTRCYNRSEMERDLTDIVQLKSRYGHNASLLVLDIDHFKSINDQLGHDKGDEILIELVQVLRHRIRSTDVLYRFGGEEFVIVLRNTGLMDARVLAEDIRLTVEGHAFHNVRQLTISIGGSELQPGDSSHSWFVRCDQRLYQAKRDGRNRVEMT